MNAMQRTSVHDQSSRKHKTHQKVESKGGFLAAVLTDTNEVPNCRISTTEVERVCVLLPTHDAGITYWSDLRKW